MNLASWVAVAVAVGPAGMGYANTGLFASPATDVCPMPTPSVASRCGLGVIGGAAGEVPAKAALNAPCGPDHSRIIRSSAVVGIGVALPLPGTSSAPWMSSFQAYAPLRTSIVEQL